MEESREVGALNQNPRYAVPLDNINQGTVAVESSRAIAEAQGKLVIAKRFPRDEELAYTNAIRACKRKKMAETAFYAFEKGKSIVSGPSIKFAQELARCWGNIDYGIKEMSRDEDKSEMQAYAWDMETNTISVQNFTNPHIREVNGCLKKLTSTRDIYEINANMATRRLRGRILAVLPGWLVDDCVEECKKTLGGNNNVPLADRAKKLLVAFEKFGVTKKMIEDRCGHSITALNEDEYVELIGIGNSLRDKITSVSDWFKYANEQPMRSSESLDNLLFANENNN